ncbi:hypothetical protein LP416_23435 [Polaromonas sp. P2-4]|nr:hypothetical protein LP416_23435 [Polaromonas sp. P2-4]
MKQRFRGVLILQVFWEFFTDIFIIFRYAWLQLERWAEMSTYSNGTWLALAGISLLMGASVGALIHAWWLRRIARAAASPGTGH